MRVALLSDVHANLVALEAVLAAIGPTDELWVTGDTVGYGPDPSDTLALLTERGAVLLAGNHDRAVATGAGLEVFNRAAAEAARMHREWLSAEERDRLAALPEVDVRHAFSICHGSFRDPIWEYVFTAAIAEASLASATTAHGCCGHTHVPTLFAERDGMLLALRPADGESHLLGPRALVNPGSVGQPRDGNPRAAYAILEPDAMRVTFHRVAYDIEETQRRMSARKLPPILADRLAHGL